MNGLEFVTRKTEKNGNSNDVVGQEGKKVKANKRGTFCLVEGDIFASQKTCRIQPFLATS